MNLCACLVVCMFEATMIGDSTGANGMSHCNQRVCENISLKSKLVLHLVQFRVMRPKVSSHVTPRDEAVNRIWSFGASLEIRHYP